MNSTFVAGAPVARVYEKCHIDRAESIRLVGPAATPYGRQPGDKGASACGFGSCTGLYVAVHGIGGAEAPAAGQLGCAALP